MVTTQLTVQQSNVFLYFNLFKLSVDAFIPRLKSWAFCCYDRKIMVNEVITRKGEKYVYNGDIPNRYIVKESIKNYTKEQGRLPVFVEDKNDPSTLLVYVSAKFYKDLVKTLYPAYGRSVLVKGKNR